MSTAANAVTATGSTGGFELRPGATTDAFEIGPGITVYAIAKTGTQDIRVIELS